MELEQEQRKGGDASFILNHDIFKEAWKAFEDSLRAQRIKVGIKDTDMHTKLIMAEQTLNVVKKYIEDVMNTGKLADVQLQTKSRFKVFG